MVYSRLVVRVSSVLSALVVLLAAHGIVQAATHTVSITPTQFVPATLRVTVGDSINFLNTTSATHSAKTSVASGFNTGNIGAGQSKMVTVSNVGTYTYTSAFNSSLTGTVEVVASATAAGGLTSTTSSTSTTLTSQPAQTQSQPVSGVEEVLVAVVAVGLSAIGLGWYAQRRVQQGIYSELVDVPIVRVIDPPSHE